MLPTNSKVENTTSLDVKREWLYNEWDERCQFSKHITLRIPNRHTIQQQIHSKLIEEVFHHVRGKYSLWGPTRELASWKKVTTNLSLQWVRDNVNILYPHHNTFNVEKLEGIVLFKTKKSDKWHLLEGNHRISAWVNNNHPQSIPAILFFGE